MIARTWRPGGARARTRHAFNFCHSNYQEGSCFKYHFDCTGESGLTLELLDRIEHGSPSDLRSLVDRHPKVEYNPERHAVQAVNCRGAVVAHFPLTAARESTLGG